MSVKDFFKLDKFKIITIIVLMILMYIQTYWIWGKVGAICGNGPCPVSSKAPYLLNTIVFLPLFYIASCILEWVVKRVKSEKK